MGVDWGDSGKGRLIDDLSSRAHVIARYSGGSNTGHTVRNKFGKFALHITPSGIFNQEAICLVGRNVAVNLQVLKKEVEEFRKAKVSIKNLKVDANAHLTMPWHIKRDGLKEKLRDKKIGTTGNGVGPTYADRTERTGLRVKDLISSDLKSKITAEVEIQNKFYDLNLSAGEIYSEFKTYLELVKPLIADTISLLHQAINSGKNILFEGAQGWLLDIDAGTYPYVTSSNPGIVGIIRSFDIHPSKINRVVGITKSYMTRVGAGPMPTKIEGALRSKIIEKGHEYGTTTGRERDPGWLDLAAIKKACRVNGITDLAVTKMDVLSGLGDLKICTKYQVDGKEADYPAGDADRMSKCRPVYSNLGGWDEDITKVRDFDKLPKEAINYIRQIEKVTDVPVSFISVGPERGEVIYA